MKPNWRWYAGSTMAAARDFVLSRRSLPLMRAYPRGTVCAYDMQRFAGTRDLRMVFDIGANVGQTIRGLLRYLPEASFHAFEPVPATFEKLRAAYGGRENISLHNVALGAHTHTARMTLHENSELDTFVAAPTRESAGATSFAEVPVSTVDAFCAARSLQAIDVLKMDVQGWELNVLQGAERMVREHRVRFVLSEVAFRRADTDMQHFADINDHLESRGFTFCGLYDVFRWGARKEYVGFANALYLDPGFLEGPA